MGKETYYKRFKEQLDSLGTNRPTLLLHVCCAPCSSAPLLLLREHFAVTVDYCNPNIQPEEEFRHRADEEKRFLCLLAESGPAIAYQEEAYDPKSYDQAVQGHEHDGEGSTRCRICYELRLRSVARRARDEGFAWFSTVMSVSPYKNAAWLNEIGERLEHEFGVKFLASDFKKDDGYKKTIELSRVYGLYRQDYCGCPWSRAERDAKREKENEPHE